MLFDIGWSELLLIGGVALVVVGPKDLPKTLRLAGYWMRKARNLSREFQSSVDQMIREAELDEMRQELKKVTDFDIEKEFHNTIEPPSGVTGSSEAGPPPAALSSPETPSPESLPPASVEPVSAPAADAASVGVPVEAPPPMHGFEPSQS